MVRRYQLGLLFHAGSLANLLFTPPYGSLTIAMLEHIKGPDFPTAATVMGLGGIREAYATGRGRVVMRARVHTEELKGGRNALIVIISLPTAIPTAASPV